LDKLDFTHGTHLHRSISIARSHVPHNLGVSHGRSRAMTDAARWCARAQPSV